MTIKVRPFRNSDQVALIALWYRVGLAASRNDSGSDIQRKLGVNSMLFLVTTFAELIVG